MRYLSALALVVVLLPSCRTRQAQVADNAEALHGWSRTLATELDSRRTVTLNVETVAYKEYSYAANQALNCLKENIPTAVISPPRMENDLRLRYSFTVVVSPGQPRPSSPNTFSLIERRCYDLYLEGTEASWGEIARYTSKGIRQRDALLRCLQPFRDIAALSESIQRDVSGGGKCLSASPAWSKLE